MNSTPEEMSGRELGEGFVEFTATGPKQVIACNPKPRVAGEDDGIWRRVEMVRAPRAMIRRLASWAGLRLLVAGARFVLVRGPAGAVSRLAMRAGLSLVKWGWR